MTPPPPRCHRPGQNDEIVSFFGEELDAKIADRLQLNYI